MSNLLGKLFFPLANLKLPRVFSAGAMTVDLEVTRKDGRYSSAFAKDGKPLKLSLEKIEQHEFTQALLQSYYFREPDKEYGAPRQILARLGLHQKTPLEMEYADQKYVLRMRVKRDSIPLELQLFYSPSVGRIVVRKSRGAPA